MDYKTFLHCKTQFGADAGFEPVFTPDFLLDFQRKLVDWAVRKGRPEKLAEPLRWKKPRRVFVNSMSDLFHNGCRKPNLQ